MTTEPDERLDQKLRDAYAVDEGAAGRVADRALTGASRRLRAADRILRLRTMFAPVAITVAVLIVVAWLSRPTIAPPVVPLAVRTAAWSGTLVDGVLIVPIPGEVIVIAGPDRRDDRPPDGSGIVFVEGGIR